MERLFVTAFLLKSLLKFSLSYHQSNRNHVEHPNYQTIYSLYVAKAKWREKRGKKAEADQNVTPEKRGNEFRSGRALAILYS